jgi:AraC-like DNA-binding protein
MYRDYIITAISLLVIALILGGIRVRKYNFPYLYFLFGVVVASFLLTDPVLVGDTFVKILFPLFVPFLYIIGPGIYGSIQPLEARRNPWHIIHYLPVIFGFSMLFFHWFFDKYHYYDAVTDARDFIWEDTRTFYPFSDAYILLGYPIFTALYYILTIRKLREYKAERNKYILPVGMLIFSPFLWDTVHQFLYGNGYFIHDGATLRYILVGAVLVIFWDVVIVKPPRPKEVTDLLKEEEPLIAPYPYIEAVPNEAMAIYIIELAEESNAKLFQKFKNKEAFIKSTEFSSEEWDQFFAFTRTSWNYLKKYIRIRRTIQLIEEGFLSEANIDALAEEVGYSSRASLYSAFKQVMGTSLPDFRLEREV